MTETYFYTTMETPVGEIVLTSDGKAITGLYTEGYKHYAKFKKGVHDPKPFTQAVKQLGEYFEGKRRDFDLPLAPAGTEFQQRVWKALCGIGYGKTKSYGEVAKTVRNPKASRAVGMANNKNPISIIVPCHRVVGADGSLTGYGGGLKAKEWLLQHEAAH